MGQLAEITSEQEFVAKVLKSPLPVLVDFWGDDCPPCLRMLPRVEELARVYTGRVAVFKMNVFDAPAVPADYGITSIPSFILFKEGEPLEGFTGVMTVSQMAEMLDRQLGPTGDGKAD